MAVLTSGEITDQAELSYVRGTYEIALTFSGTDYENDVTLATVEADEVTVGDGGYARLSYTYSSADLDTFGNGQPFAPKTAQFVHDGSSGNIVFNHVVLLRNISGVVTVVGYQLLPETVTLTNSNFVRINIRNIHGAQ